MHPVKINLLLISLLACGSSDLLSMDIAIQQEESVNKRIEITDDCPICLEALLNDTPLAYLDCAKEKVHIYHLDCLRQHIILGPQRNEQSTCPLCREVVNLFDTRHLLKETDREKLEELLATDYVKKSVRAFSATAFEQILDQLAQELESINAQIDEWVNAQDEPIDELEVVEQWLSSKLGSPWNKAQVLQNGVYQLDEDSLLSSINALNSLASCIRSIGSFCISILDEIGQELRLAHESDEVINGIIKDALAQDDIPALRTGLSLDRRQDMVKTDINATFGELLTVHNKQGLVRDKLDTLLTEKTRRHHALEQSRKRLHRELFHAAGENDRDTVVALSQSVYFAELINEDFANGFTLLHNAAFHRAENTVQCLLELGANPEAINDRGFTPYEVTNNVKIRNMIYEYKKGFMFMMLNRAKRFIKCCFLLNDNL